MWLVLVQRVTRRKNTQHFRKQNLHRIPSILSAIAKVLECRHIFTFYIFFPENLSVQKSECEIFKRVSSIKQENKLEAIQQKVATNEKRENTVMKTR